MAKFPLVADCRLELSTRRGRIRRWEQVREQLGTATMTYREMDTGFGLVQAEAELANAT